MTEYVFDIEADNLLDDATKIHVLSYAVPDGAVVSTTDYDEMRSFFLNADRLIGHNIVRYDIPLVEKLLGVKVKADLVDTLVLSWYLNFNRVRHGLAQYGDEYGVPKPVVDDWENLSVAEYTHRCEEDVKINLKLWQQLNKKLKRLYHDEEKEERIVRYLSFKMQCAATQEALGWRLDVVKAQAHYDKLEALKVEKEEALADAMPKRILTRKMNPPAKMYKADGELSVTGERWLQALADNYLPPSTNQPITVRTGEEKGNPNSNDQVKDWLYDLGWKPRTFKYIRGENYGEERKIPQVRKDSELCESILELIEEHPVVELLDGLTVITHRLSVLKGFLTSHKDGVLKAEIAGLTNTFRFKHMKPLVNLPGVDKPWGEEIRGCLIAPEGYTLCGSDMVSLEDTTKRHYMQPIDPDYVAEMSREGYDAHLDLCKFAGVVTQEDIDKHNTGEKDLSALRKKYKAVNYSAIYGVGAANLSRTTGMKQREAKKLIEAYWERNWSVKKVSEEQKVRTIGDETWLLNPVSGFWHNLRSDKDRFSTLNQSTGVFCFDTWIAILSTGGLWPIGQFHDEVILAVPKGQEEDTKAHLKRAISMANNKFRLNVPLDVDVQFGSNYAEIH